MWIAFSGCNGKINYMISDIDKQQICEVSKKYNAKKVILFGSNLSGVSDAMDIDLAVEGVSPEDFFDYYSELIFSLSKPVDLVDLANKNKFTDIVEKEGLVVYGNV